VTYPSVRPGSNKLDRRRFALELSGVESIVSVLELDDVADRVSDRVIVSS
jgi:hypothetical protein